MLKYGRAAAFVWALSGIVGCGAGDPAGSGEEADGENIGVATFELTSVPSGVGCVRLTVNGSSTVTKDFTLAANASTAALNMDRLPLGAIAIDGAAYAATCGTGSTLYIADTATASLRAGVVSNVSLTFRKNNPVTASVNFVGNVQAISTQWQSSYAVIDGTVYFWGYNVTQGATKSVPTAVAGLTGVADLSQGSDSMTACAVKTDGTVWCWGWNSSGAAGANPATVGSVSTPTRVGSDTGYTMVAGGPSHTCAAAPAFKFLKCWGSNATGQLGNNSTVDSYVPTLASLDGSSARSLAASNLHSCAINGSLEVLCWGKNSNFQLGDASSTDRLVPTRNGVTLAKSVSATGYGACATLLDGTAKCWGHNFYGTMGDGTLVSRSTPTTVVGLTGVNKIASGSFHNCALLDSGGVKCWGYNQSGQLGDGTLTNRPTPITVSLPDPAVLISAGDAHTCAVTSRQDIYCWGNNTNGQLGDGTLINSPRPVKVKLP